MVVFAQLRKFLQPLGLARRSLTNSHISTLISPPPPRLLGLHPALNTFTNSQIPRWFLASSWRLLYSLTDTRFPKRRPANRSRRKRASLRPSGPYAWVQYVQGEPIPRSLPNEGSVKGRNHKKRIKQRKAFILSERKKRKVQMQEAKKKKRMERVERKMAAVARERAWAERLAELQKLENEKARPPKMS